MTDTAGSGTHEERPKISWWLWAAAGFFAVFTLTLLELPSGVGKFMWLAIALLNLAANLMQIRSLSRLRYVLWRRGLSIYSGNNREALVRFDRALVFRKMDRQTRRGLRAELKDYGITKPPRSYGASQWLVVFDREDGEPEALMFDPSPQLETLFRRRLIEADQADQSEDRGAAAGAGEVPEAGPGPAGVAPPAPGEDWQEEPGPDAPGPAAERRTDPPGR